MMDRDLSRSRTPVCFGGGGGGGGFLLFLLRSISERHCCPVCQESQEFKLIRYRGFGRRQLSQGYLFPVRPPEDLSE